MAYKDKEKEKAYRREYYQRNKENRKAYCRKYYKENREKTRKKRRENMVDKKIYDREYYQNNKERIYKRNRKWVENNSERVRELEKKWVRENIERARAKNRNWIKNHRDKINKYKKHKYNTDKKYNLANKMSNSIKRSLSNNKAGRSWESLTGYTLADLVKQLNETMPAGYTWQDFLSGELHIDHIIPISAFNFTKPEHIDFKKCWYLENLRLLPAEENMIKHNKLDRPFQPALRI